MARPPIHSRPTANWRSSTFSGRPVGPWIWYAPGFLQKKRPVAVTTIATMLKLMREKGLVERGDGLRGYVWSAKVSRKAARTGLLGKLLDLAFEGSAQRLVATCSRRGSSAIETGKRSVGCSTKAGGKLGRKKGRPGNERVDLGFFTSMANCGLDDAPLPLGRGWPGRSCRGRKAGPRRASPDVRYAYALASLVSLLVAPVAIAWLIADGEPAPARRPTARRTELFWENLDSRGVRPYLRDWRGAELAVRLRHGRTVVASAKAGCRRRIHAGTLAGRSAFDVRLPGSWIGGRRAASAAKSAGRGCRSLARCDGLAAALGIARRVGVGVCDRVAAPLLVGIVRPLILFPAAALAGWSPDQIEMALLHELAHVRRHDNAVNLLQRLVESALFFHPAVWIVSRWVRLEREQCCDRIVVGHTGRAHEYAEALRSSNSLGRPRARRLHGRKPARRSHPPRS